MRVAIYTRVSTEEQAIHGISLQAQETALKEYADKHHMTVTDVYTDEGYSATTLDRPSLTRLLEDAKKGKFEKLIFTKLDRLTRGVKNYYRIMEVLQENNIDWKTILEDYDSSTASGRLHINIMLSVAENESAVIKERINFVFRDKVRRGEVLSGSKIFGYDIVNKKYAINEEEAEIVRFAFDEYLRTGNLSHVTRAANANFELKTTKRIITSVLDRKLYRGVYMYKGEEIDNFAPVIIPKEIFEKAQAMRKVTARQKKPNTINPFSRLVKCHKNKCIYIERHDPRYHNGLAYTYLRCWGTKCPYLHNKECTPMKNVRFEVFEEKVLDELIKVLSDSYALTPQVNKSDSETEIKKINAKITTLKSKLSRLQDLYIDGMIEKDKYIDKHNSIKIGIKQLEDRRADLSVDVFVPDPEVMKVITNGDIKDVYKAMTEEQKRIFWVNAVSGIKVDKDWNPSIIF